MARPNRSRQAVLGFLTWGPMSGYDIKKAIEGSISNFWSESFGQIYPILKRLVEDGCATRTDTETSGGRARHVYAITDAGRAELDQWLAEAVPPSQPRNELLLKLFFAARNPAGTTLAWLGEYREGQAAKLGRYAGIRAQLEAADPAPPDRDYWLMTLRYGELEAQALVAWCDETLAQLRDAADASDTSDTSEAAERGGPARVG